MPGDTVEIAEFAIGDADIRSVHIPVDLPGDTTVRYLFLTQFITHIHQVRQRRVMVQKHTFLYGKKLKIQGFLIKRSQLSSVIVCHK
jgi:hypothetical protein